MSMLMGMIGNTSAAASPLPLDALTAAAAYSFRKLRTAYAGNAVRLRRDSDNTEQDFGFTTGGDLDAASITTWLGGANGYGTTFYDQSGNALDLTQATANVQPLYVTSLKNGKSGFYYQGARMFTAANIGISGNADRSIAVVCAVLSNVRSITGWGEDDNNKLFALGRFSGWYITGYNNDIRFSGTHDEDWHSHIVTASGTNSEWTVDGVSRGIESRSAYDTTNTPLDIGDSDALDFADDYLTENILFSTALSGTDLATIQTSQADYWDLP